MEACILHVLEFASILWGAIIMNKHAAIVTFTAALGKGDEVARLIAAALPQAHQETGMPLWLVLQAENNRDTVHIVDIFNSEADRAAHLQLGTAAQIIATVPPHLAAPLDIAPMQVYAAKGL